MRISIAMMDDNDAVFLDTNVLIRATIESAPLGGKQVHDANIVATMQAYGVIHLFTLNTADFLRFTPLITLVTLEEILNL